MRSPEEYDTPGALEDLSEMALRSLMCCGKSLFSSDAGSLMPDQLTSSQTRPPRLWQTNIMGRPFCSSKPGFNGYHLCCMLTVSSFSLYAATAASRFIAWLPIRFLDTMPRHSATYASYPNVSIRVSGSSDESRVCGHGDVALFARHVLWQSPVRP